MFLSRPETETPSAALLLLSQGKETVGKLKDSSNRGENIAPFDFSQILILL